jgi:hypothetical protein
MLVLCILLMVWVCSPKRCQEQDELAAKNSSFIDCKETPDRRAGKFEDRMLR